jgi:hypothetical protein
MVIEKNGHLYSLAGNYQLSKGEDHLRIGAEGGKTGFKIGTTNPDGAYDAIKLGLKAGKKYISLEDIDDVPDAEAPVEEAPPEEPTEPTEPPAA